MLQKFIVLILLSFTLLGCSQSVTVTGNVQEVIGEASLSIIIEEGDYAGTYHIGIPESSNETFNVGDKVEIEFDGQTMESAPGRIQADTIKIIN